VAERLTQDSHRPDCAVPDVSSAANRASVPHSLCGGKTIMSKGGGLPGACWCAVDHGGQIVEVHWGVGRHVLGAGAWPLELEVDGLAVLPPARWEEVCRQTEDGVEYVELEGRAGRGIRVCRHVMVAQKDGFLFLADAIVLCRPAELRYSAILPLGRKIICEPAAETWEARLVDGRRRAWVLPLALPEWREDPRRGELVPVESGLALRRLAKGRALFAPLFIDLNARRQGKPLTWRALTVAENFRIQPADVAVGYRVQIGSQQWLVYRSLGPKGNRSLLGHNLVSETLIARFAKGQVEPLIEIE